MALYEILEDGTPRKVAGNAKTLTFDDIYPIGSIYITTSTSATGITSPASIFGGTWELLPEGYALWTTTSGAGETISAGLPNITGLNGGVRVSATSAEVSGAFYRDKSASKASLVEPEGHTISFDASRSNPIYGKSTTVQPPAYKVYAWKRIS